jgi:hypothetical protein
MITLNENVVLVRLDSDYPENSPKKWRVLVGEITYNEELKAETMAEAEVYGVDHVNAICSVVSWSGLTPSGLFKHHLLLKGEHFDVRENENGESMAIVGTIVENTTETPTEEETDKAKTINPETELDAE